jgi:hypothetical protein
MNYRKQLAAAMSAGALVLGMLGMSAGAVLATNQVAWDGNRGTDGNGNVSDNRCNQSNNVPYLYWVFNPGGNDSVESASITFGGTGAGTFAMEQVSDNGTWKLTDGDWFDLVGLTAVVTFTGELGNGNAVVTISHGCPGQSTTTTTTTTAATTTTTAATTTTTAATTTTTQETSSTTAGTTTTTSFTQTQSGITDVPTQPNTAAIGTGGPSNPGNGTWMLLLALGLLLGSVVILTPAKAKNRS